MDYKKITEIFAMVVPPLILCSCVRLVTYYNHWNIPILDYLSYTEILLSFIEPGLIMMLFAGIYFAGVSMFVGLTYLSLKIKKPKSTSSKSNEPVQEASNGNKESTTKKDKIKLMARIISIIFIIYVYVKAIWFDYNIIMVVIFHTLLFVIVIRTVNKLSDNKEERASTNSIILGILLTLLSASYFYGRYQIHNTLTNPSQYSLMLTDSTKIETYKNLLYLGKTSNFYFLYNSDSIKSIIIPAGLVKKIEIKPDTVDN